MRIRTHAKQLERAWRFERRRRKTLPNHDGDADGAGESGTDPAVTGDEPSEGSRRDFPSPPGIAGGLGG